MHQDEHMGIKRFVCKFCDRRFQCLANKLKHERRHIGEKKYKCDVCEKAFIEKPELKSHLKVHEKNGLREKEKPESKQSESATAVETVDMPNKTS